MDKPAKPPGSVLANATEQDARAEELETLVRAISRYLVAHPGEGRTQIRAIKRRWPQADFATITRAFAVVGLVATSVLVEK